MSHQGWYLTPRDFIKLGALLVQRRGCEALSSHENTRNQPEIIKNQWSWKWTTTRMDTSWGTSSDQWWYLTPRDFIKLDFKKSLFTIGGVIQNLGKTQLESTWKIIIIDVENSSFGYNLTIWNWVKRGLDHSHRKTLISETCPLEESASHHLPPICMGLCWRPFPLRR